MIWVPMPTTPKYRGDQKGQEGCEGDELAQREGSGEDLARADEHDYRADDAHEHGGREAHEGHGGERGFDVRQQPFDASGEDFRFALFGVITLDDADAAQGFGQAAGDFGVDFAALAEDGADFTERFARARRRSRRRTAR